jgi:hypothetical protein
MDISAKKLELIEEFLKISDESIIEKLESLIRLEKKKTKAAKVKPMQMDDFKKMIDQAKKDKDEGRVISHQDLKSKIKSWRS